MVDHAGSAASDDRHGDRVADQPDELEVVPVLGAVAIHGVEQDLARAQPGRACRPLDGVDAGAAPAAVRGHLESAVGAGRTPGVDREHEHLVAEPVGDLSDDLRTHDRCRVDADLVGTGAEQPIDVVDRADAAADGQWDEYLLGRAGHNVVGRRSITTGRRDVEEDKLVGALLVVRRGQAPPGRQHRAGRRS